MSGHLSAGAACAAPTRPERRRHALGQQPRGAQPGTARTRARELHLLPGPGVFADTSAGAGIAPARPSFPIDVTDSTAGTPTAADAIAVTGRGAFPVLPVTIADPLLVARRHVDFLRIRSSIRCTGR